MDPYTVYINSDKLQKKFQSFLDGNETEMYSAEGLPAVCRKAWHDLAEIHKLHSASAGEGACRHVIVSKRPFGNSLLIMSATVQRRFRDDFGIKINLCDYNDFEYYVDLYGIRQQLNMTLDSIGEFAAAFEEMKEGQQKPSELAWINYLNEIKKAIWAHITASDGYKRFMAADLKHFKSDTQAVQNKLKLGNNYLVPENDGKLYISIDIKGADFAALKWFDASIFDGKSWEDFIDKFVIDHPKTALYLKASKLFRLKVFWELSHRRQSIIWEYLITQVAKKYFGEGVRGYHVSDEIVFEVNDILSFQDIQTDNMFRVRYFRLRHVAVGKSWMVREIIDTAAIQKIDIKCCNPTEYTIVWKHLHGIPMEPRDYKYRWNQETNDWDYTEPPTFKFFVAAEAF
jgi:hypothetical protein